MARKKAQRPKIPPSRTKLIAAAGVFVVLVVWLGFGIRSVPDGAIGVLDSLFRGSRVLEPGVNLTVPGLERVQILDPYRRAGSLAYETPEGATLDITVDVAVHLTADGASELVSRSKGSGPIERLDASVDAILTGLL